ncbi:tubulin-like doman-containing protein [Cyanobacterium aponinum]|uniref:Tubulin-like protein n=1 Tax=Cyanobacterium aponinum 0216 TaxID=2676140 RepID=A0A844GUV5_9CHRO|nr:tubulin-like doman-containing protein [Cyanobacterium aponinum]MTF39880.1 hypothetical protein [Cyanobacterium aponinum 0216]
MPQEIQKIKRTICIGLGGTGKEILMQIRRLIVDRHGKLENLPIVSFVHIDTNQNEHKTTGLKTGDTHRGENLLFKPSEVVMATMNRQQINELSNTLQETQKNQQTSPFDHIAKWFHPKLCKNLQSIENGAGAVRSVGRLGFFHNHNQIRTIIENADNRTNGYSETLMRRNIAVEQGLNIIVVGSLCGGTGSGTFIDMAYTLRKMYHNQVSTDFIGYFIISPELYGNNDISKANTYAALKELDYYSSEKNRFQCDYDAQGIFSVNESRSPFDFCYLVGNRTYNGHKITSRENLSYLIAHRIFAEFAEENAISNRFRGIRDNNGQAMELYDRHSRPNTQRYITFGLAKIYFPRDLIIANCLNKLKLNILYFWLYGEEKVIYADELLKIFLLKWRTRDEKDYQIFATKIEEISLENNQTFKQKLKKWQNRLITQIENCRTLEDRQQFTNILLGEVRNQFKDIQQGQTESIRGKWLTLLQQSSIKINREFNADIDSHLENLLDPFDTNFSIENSRSWLEAMITKLNECLRDLQEEKEKSSSFITLEQIEKETKKIIEILQDIETEKAGCLGLGFMSNKAKNQKFQDSAIRGMQDIYRKLLLRNFELVLLDESINIVSNLLRKVKERRSQINSFYNLLDELNSYYHKREQELSQINHQEINGEAIFSIQDHEEYYQILLPEIEKHNLLVEISQNITKKTIISQSIANFFINERMIRKEELHEVISSTIEVKFGAKTVDLTKSVVNRFMEKYPFSNAETRLQQIRLEAEWLLPLNLSDPYLVNVGVAPLIQETIAFKQTDEIENQNFKNLLLDKIGVTADRLLSIQSKNEIIFLQEIGGFPLRIINGIEELRTQYEKQKFSFYLHNDYTKNFLDIIPPPEREMKQLQNIFYTCLAFGLITRKITVDKYNSISPADQNQNAIVIQKPDDIFNDRYQDVELSPIWAEALEEVWHKTSLYQRLKEKKQELIEDIRQNPSSWQHYENEFKSFVDKVNKLTDYDDNFNQKELLMGDDAYRSSNGILAKIYQEFKTIIEQVNYQYSDMKETDNVPDIIDVDPQ